MGIAQLRKQAGLPHGLDGRIVSFRPEASTHSRYSVPLMAAVLWPSSRRRRLACSKAAEFVHHHATVFSIGDLGYQRGSCLPPTDCWPRLRAS